MWLILINQEMIAKHIIESYGEERVSGYVGFMFGELWIVAGKTEAFL